MHTHCVPCVMNSICAGFSCAGFHAYQVLFVMNSRAYRVPVTLGSTHTGLHLLPILVHRSLVCRVPSTLTLTLNLLPVLVLRVLPVMNSSHAGFHACRTPTTPAPTTPAPCTPGSMCYEFLCVLFLCVVNSMLAGFHARRVLCFMNSMHAGL